MTGGLGSVDVESAAALPEAARQALRDLLLALADNKRLLGMRYSDRMLGSPSLETGIAAASMAQDEWGHGRLTYALLTDFGDDPFFLEHEREPSEYSSMELLDLPFESWPALIAGCLLIDGALTVQYEALLDSRYAPIRNRAQKLLNEEVLHFQYAAGWVCRIAASPLLDELSAEAGRMLPRVLEWFGPEEADGDGVLQEMRLSSRSPEALRGALLERVAPVLDQAGLTKQLGLERIGDDWGCTVRLEWRAWNERRRRAASGGPDAETIGRVRGDRNRAMLLD